MKQNWPEGPRGTFRDALGRERFAQSSLKNLHLVSASHQNLSSCLCSIWPTGSNILRDAVGKETHRPAAFFEQLLCSLVRASSECHLANFPKGSQQPCRMHTGPVNRTATCETKGHVLIAFSCHVALSPSSLAPCASGNLGMACSDGAEHGAPRGPVAFTTPGGPT